MDVRERAAARTLLLDARGPGRLAQHPTLSDKHDVAVGELLLEFTGQPAVAKTRSIPRTPARNAQAARLNGDRPLLDLVERLQLGDGDKNDDGLLATADVDLARGGDLEGPELALQLGRAVLEVDHGLSNGSLSFIGGRLGRVRRAEDLVLDGHLAA